MINKNLKPKILDQHRSKLCPYWITGFSDAESTFSIRLSKDKNRKTGWRILPIFSIELHQKDLLLLEQISLYFGVGNIYTKKSNGHVSYSVQSFKDLTNTIIPHFDKYPLLTKKRNDYELFKLVLDLLNKKEQSSYNGLQSIINIRAAMNKGLSKELLINFPKTVPYSMLVQEYNYCIHPNWLVGFVDGEGCFYIKPTKSSFMPVLSISQHTRDISLLNKIRSFLNCGILQQFKTRPLQSAFLVNKFGDIENKIIPFFNKYSLQGVKKLDFEDFSKITYMLKRKSTFTLEDINEIKSIKSNMNKGRFNK